MADRRAGLQPRTSAFSTPGTPSSAFVTARTQCSQGHTGDLQSGIVHGLSPVGNEVKGIIQSARISVIQPRTASATC